MAEKSGEVGQAIPVVISSRKDLSAQSDTLDLPASPVRRRPSALPCGSPLMSPSRAVERHQRAQIYETFGEIRDRIHSATATPPPRMVGVVQPGRHVITAAIPGVCGIPAQISSPDGMTRVQDAIWLLQCGENIRNVVCTSGLTEAEKLAVGNFVRNMPGGQFQSGDVTNRTRYLVVPTVKSGSDYLCAAVTVNYLKALTWGAEVISFDWVIKCCEAKLPLAPVSHDNGEVLLKST